MAIDANELITIDSMKTPVPMIQPALINSSMSVLPTTTTQLPRLETSLNKTVHHTGIHNIGRTQNSQQPKPGKQNHQQTSSKRGSNNRNPRAQSNQANKRISNNNNNNNVRNGQMNGNSHGVRAPPNKRNNNQNNNRNGPMKGNNNSKGQKPMPVNNRIKNQNNNRNGQNSNPRLRRSDVKSKY